ncbi:MAG: hypothetical protein MUO23_09610 [Anaerolineales bacterium]|nr:hypothetical protein [Anaerolineales bacterium]
MRQLSISLALALLVLIGQGGAQAQTPTPIDQALTWLRTQQQPDGGFSNGFAPGSDPGTTADSVLAIVAGGQDPSAWQIGDATPLAYLEAALGAQPPAPGLAAKLALAAVAAGSDPTRLGGVDLIAAVESAYEPASGLYGSGPFDSALALLALHAAARPIPAEAAEGLLAYRLEDGSFAFSGDRTPGSGDSNTTALAVQALVAAGRVGDVGPSIAYFLATQNADGGWTYQKPSAFGEATDANSTALVIQALLAAGEDLSTWGDPRLALLSLQAPSGAFIFNAATSAENLLATVQAIPAAAGMNYTGVGTSTGGAGDLGPPVRLDTRLVAGVLGALTLILIGGAWVARRSRQQA